MIFEARKAVAAVNQGNLGGEAGEEQGFFHGRIAAADHDDFLSGKKEAVAGSAGRDPVTNELLLVGSPSQRADAPLAMMSACVCTWCLPRCSRNGRWLKSTLVRCAMRYSAPKRSACLRMFSINCGPMNAFGKAGKIFYQRGQRKLAAGLVALNDERLQIGARCVKCGRVSGASGTDNDDVASFAHNLCRCNRLDCRLQISMQVLEWPRRREAHFR